MLTRLLARLGLGPCLSLTFITLALGLWTGCGGDTSPTSISVTATATTLVAGAQTDVTAHYVAPNGASAATDVIWTSSDPAVLTVTGGPGGHATVRGVAAGTAMVRATAGGLAGSVEITVTPAVLETITVTPPAPSLAAGTTVQLTAEGHFSDGAVRPLTAGVAWSSSAAAATVDDTGLVHGAAPGAVTITADVGGVAGTAAVTVTAATLASIAVTPTNPSVAAGLTRQLTATGTFTDNSVQDLTGQVTWTATQAAATVSTAGLVTAVTPGSAKITATLGAVTGDTTVTVTSAVLATIDVTPAAPSLALGRTLAFTATGTLSDHTTADLTSQVTWDSATKATATIDAAGIATAKATGASVITATLGAISGNTTVTVTSAELVSLAITPPQPSVAAGRTLQLTATGTFSDATTQDLTAQVAWGSTMMAFAQVSNTAGSRGLASTMTAGTTTVSATLGLIVGTTDLTVTNAVLDAISITPPSPKLPLGAPRQLTATGTFSDHSAQDLTTQVTWDTSLHGVATVSNAAGEQGLATPVAIGATTITATLGLVVGSTDATVTPAVLTALEVTPVNPSLAAGLTLPFKAIGTFSDATTQDLTTQVTWTSSAPLVASISSAAGVEGVATGLTTGAATITAQSGAIKGTSLLTVSPATVAALQITPINPSTAIGLDLPFTAIATLTDATTQEVTTQVTWASSDGAVATISNAVGSAGVATTSLKGPTTISATLGAIVATTTLTVTDATLLSLAITPPAPSVALGRTLALAAVGTFSDASTHDLTTQVTWTATGTAATVSGALGSEGVVTGAALGTSTITAALGAVTTLTDVTVTPAILTSIALTPLDASVAAGQTVAYAALGTFSDGSTQDLTTQVTWGSTLSAHAQISNAVGTQGVATTLVAGPTTISATLGAVSASTTLTVTSATLTSIAVTPAGAALPKGRTQAYLAVGTYSDASTQDLTSQVTWSSSMTMFAQASNAVGSQGLVTAVGIGATTITATLGAVKGSTTLTVTAAVLSSLTVTPATASVVPGATQQFAATGTFSDGSTLTLTGATGSTWTSSDPTMATISNATGSHGLATTIKPGTVTITITNSGVVGTATLTVLDLEVASFAPGDGMAGIRTSTPISVTFNQPITPATLTAQTTAGACAGSLQLSADGFASCLAFTAAAPTMSANNAVATATPAALLAPLTTYQVRVTTAVKTPRPIALVADVTMATGFTTATDGPCGASLLLSQVYGGGGNVGSTLNADFIELHNTGPSAVALGGLSLQYASATGAGWTVAPLPAVSVPAGGYYRVQASNATANGAAFTSDYTAVPQLSLSATNGKVALVPGTAALTTACPLGQTIDFVGYGTASCAEGTAIAALSTTTAALRGRGGCTDAGTNSTDFTIGAPTPTGAVSLVCACNASESDTVAELDYCVLQSPASLSSPPGVPSPPVYVRAYEAGITPAAGASPLITVQVGVGPMGVNPATTLGYTWTTATFNLQYGNDDEYQGAFIAPSAGSYGYGGRVTRDGTNWTYCDIDGAGSNPGLTFDPAQLGQLTVN
jgi:hypothetical protein